MDFLRRIERKGVVNREADVARHEALTLRRQEQAGEWAFVGDESCLDGCAPWPRTIRDERGLGAGQFPWIRRAVFDGPLLPRYCGSYHGERLLWVVRDEDESDAEVFCKSLQSTCIAWRTSVERGATVRRAAALSAGRRWPAPEGHRWSGPPPRDGWASGLHQPTREFPFHHRFQRSELSLFAIFCSEAEAVSFPRREAEGACFCKNGLTCGGLGGWCDHVCTRRARG